MLIHKKGESILEILLAIAIFAIVLPGVLYTMGAMASSQPERNIFFDAIVKTEELKNRIQQIKSREWSAIATNGDYVFELDADEKDVLVPIDISPTPDPQGLTSFIRIQNVLRDDGGKISPQGENIDPATKKASIYIWWNESQTPLITDIYLSRTDRIETDSYSNAQAFDAPGSSFAGIRVDESSPQTHLTLGPGQIEAPIGLAAWWQMSGELVGSLSELDMSPSGTHNMQLHGPPNFEVGRFGNTAQLVTISQYMTASSSAMLTSSGQISVFTWLKTNAINPNSATVVHQQTAEGEGYSLTIDPEGHPVALVKNNSQTITTTHQSYVADDLWHHVGFVYDGEKLNLFVDGQSGQDEGQGLAVLPSITDPIFIGRNPNSPNKNFQGFVDDVQLYTIALDEQERLGLLYSTYTSSTKDMERSAFFYSMHADILQPENTEIKTQIALFDALNNNCAGSPHEFVGPDGTAKTYFTTAALGEQTITALVPSQSTESLFQNPARCFRWKAFFFSPMSHDNQNNPKLYNINFVYSL